MVWWIFNLINHLMDGIISNFLIEQIIVNFEWAFGTWEDEIARSAEYLQYTPENFLGGYIYTLLQNLSNTVILPIAVAIFALILAYEFIQMLGEGNNFREFDYMHLVKWGMKLVFGTILLTNVFPIMNWIFTVGANAVAAAEAEISIHNFDLGTVFDGMRDTLENNIMIEELIIVWFASFFFGFFMIVARLIIFALVIYRILLIMLKISIAPLPFATLVNREWGSIGNNYIKLLFATAFQGFLMIIILALWGYLMAYFLPTAADTAIEFILAMGGMVVTSIMLIILLIKTQQISKSIFGAH